MGPLTIERATMASPISNNSPKLRLNDVIDHLNAGGRVRLRRDDTGETNEIVGSDGLSRALGVGMQLLLSGRHAWKFDAIL
jgi:hypothetical protein